MLSEVKRIHFFGVKVEVVTNIHGKGGRSGIVEGQTLAVRADPIQVGNSHTTGGTVEGKENVMVWVGLYESIKSSIRFNFFTSIRSCNLREIR